jgi:hypothetical protein
MLIVRKDYSKLERLDLAARARLSEASIPRTIVVFAILAALVLFYLLGPPLPGMRQERLNY